MLKRIERNCFFLINLKNSFKYVLQDDAIGKQFPLALSLSLVARDLCFVRERGANKRRHLTRGTSAPVACVCCRGGIFTRFSAPVARCLPVRGEDLSSLVTGKAAVEPLTESNFEFRLCVSQGAAEKLKL